MPAQSLLNRLVVAITLFTTLFLAAGVVRATAALDVITPEEGQKYESDEITVSWQLTDFNLVNFTTYSKPKAGQGHIHLWLDEPNPTAANSIKATSGNTYQFTGVKSGSHTLVVELQNNDHTPLKPPVRKTINFSTQVPTFVNPQLPQNDFTLFLILVAIILIGGLWYFLSPESNPAPRHKKPAKKRK